MAEEGDRLVDHDQIEEYRAALDEEQRRVHAARRSVHEAEDRMAEVSKKLEEVDTLRREWRTWALGLGALAILLLLGHVARLIWSAVTDQAAQERLLWPPPSTGPLGIYKGGAVASDNVICSEIGRDILIRGGNAVDAAISVVLCLGVMNPACNGLGGGHFMTIYNKTTGKVQAVDAREVAPLAAHEHMYKGNVNGSKYGWRAPAVPGELHGLRTEFENFGSGRLPWSDLFHPILELLDNGVPVSGITSASLKQERARILNNTQFREFYTNRDTGDLYKLGEVMRNHRPMYRDTLRFLSESSDPIAYFYRSNFTSSLLFEFKDNGGIMTADDFANYSSIIRKPEDMMHIHVRGLDLYGPPPPSSAAVTLSIVKLLDNTTFDVSTNAGSVDFLHRYLEACKFAYAHRAEMGDIAFVTSALQLARNITSDGWVEETRQRIRERAQPTATYGEKYAPSRDAGTTNIAIVDQWGNAVDVTTTLNLAFGAMVASESSGIIWNSQMDDFSSPDAPNFYGYPPSPANFIKPGKRPMSSISPIIAVNATDGWPRMVAGGAGGSQIISGVSGLIAKVLYLGWDLKRAMDSPRLHNQLVPNVTLHEPHFPKEFREALEARGHVFNSTPALTQATTLVRNATTGMIFANSDFRKGPDSEPAGY